MVIWSSGLVYCSFLQRHGVPSLWLSFVIHKVLTFLDWCVVLASHLGVLSPNSTPVVQSEYWLPFGLREKVVVEGCHTVEVLQKLAANIQFHSLAIFPSPDSHPLNTVVSLIAMGVFWVLHYSEEYERSSAFWAWSLVDAYVMDQGPHDVSMHITAALESSWSHAGRGQVSGAWAHASVVRYINKSTRSRLLYGIINQIVAALPAEQRFFHLF